MGFRQILKTLELAKKDLEEEFEAEELDYDEDTVTSVELSYAEIELLIDKLEYICDEDE